MPAYWYTTSEDPTVGRRVIHASSLPAAARQLRDRDVPVRRMGVVQHEADEGWLVQEGQLGLPTTYRQLAALIDSGRPLVGALRQLSADCDRLNLARALRAISDDVASGRSLYEGMERYERIFGPEAVAVVRAGETSGQLAEALEGLVEQTETYAGIRRELRASLTYPILVAIFSVGLLFFFTTYIAPKFFRLYADLGLKQAEFPLPTLILMRISALMQTHPGPLVIAIIALLVLYGMYAHSLRGRRAIDYWSLRIPVVGTLFSCAAIGRLCTTLGVLIRHRVSAPEALRAAGEACGNRVLNEATRHAEHTVNCGGSISEGLAETDALPPTVLWNLRSAETAGNLAQALLATGRFHAQRAKLVSRAAAEAIEPIAIVLLGCLIGFAIISMMLPLITIISMLSQ